MAATEPVQGGPHPEPSDPPDGPNQLAAIVTWAAPRTVMRFASTTARDSAIPSPVEGMVAVTGSGSELTQWLYMDGQWRDITVRPWQSWTPSLTSGGSAVNVGSTGTTVGRFQRAGMTIHGWFVITFGGTGISVPTGNLTIALPATPEATYAANNAILGEAFLFDASSTTEYVRMIRHSGIFGQSNNVVTATSPFSWAAGDTIRAEITYEAAV